MDQKDIDRFWTKVNQNSNNGCWEWTAGTTAAGYGCFSLSKMPKLAHRVSYELHHPNQQISGLFICHKCDNPKCVNPAHLFAGTHKDNMRDMVVKGRSSAGEKRHTAKLTEQDVIAIRNDPRPYIDIENEYGISNPTVSYIKNRKRWRHI